MGKRYLNSKSCFSLNCCFSSNWCFNPILFKTPLTSKSSSTGLSDFFASPNENFLSDNGSVYDIQCNSNKPISGSNNKYPYGAINGIYIPSGGDSSHIGDNGNGAPPLEKGGTCGESGESGSPNPAKGNDLPLRGDSTDQKPDDSTDQKPDDSTDQKPDNLDDQKPDDSKDQKPDNLDDQKPDDWDDQKPDDLDDQKPDDSKDQKPDDSKDQKPDDLDDQKPDDSKDQKPDDLDDQKPDDSTDQKPDNLDDQKPDDLDDQKPDDLDDQKPDDSKDQKPDDLDDQKPDDSNQTCSCRGRTPAYIAALWVQCEDCLGLNYKRFLKDRNNVCEHCEYHFKMNSLERIEFLIDPDTWDPIDEDMASPDPDPDEGDSEEDSLFEERYEWNSEEDSLFEERYEWNSEEDSLFEERYESDSEEEKGKSYEDRLDSYRRRTGLNEAVQTGVGQLNGIPAAFGIMEFEFMGGSMGSVVGEKIARLVEYATNQSLPLIIVCASGGARVQEGSLSLMQMAKISSALLDYDQSNNKLYISILASPTTGGVTASFGTLADIVIAEPNSYIAFAGKRVIEETLKEPIPEGSQEAEPLFEKGIIDLIISRKFLKDVLTEFLKFHESNPNIIT
uniref:Acetyl-coenzyme A carboxylase carboxyl transferase subunit beta, chloroplastic n=1 Tax=Adenocalymma divaricatum TaxID=2099417 RepID=A0A2P1G8Y4_9LAMI|nr:acetyl-CoA carboxylase carboxyltransferase beta subunit [Adenocalymma divaricatum]AVM81406.1 acetyl-CoA carboxylase carboxyltransferase beta subunit [Adenocalymma divaricatum]